MHCTSKALITGAFGPALHRSTTLPPSFLIPSFHHVQPKSHFSTTTPHQARKDHNPSRSVSALRRSGPNKKQTLSPAAQAFKPDPLTRLRPSKRSIAAAIPTYLPKPVLDPAQRSQVQIDDDHGLWEFFNEKRASLFTPLELSNHGRAWTLSELRKKDWEDLWRLWWVCIKERNRLETFRGEKKRVGSMYGDYEADGRSGAIKATQKRIKQVLTERWYAWENARMVAMEDEEVNLYADPDKGEQAYMPKEPEEEAVATASAAENDAEALEREADELEAKERQRGRGSTFTPFDSGVGKGTEARV